MADNANDAEGKKVDEGWKRKAREEKEALEKEAAPEGAAEQPGEGEGETPPTEEEEAPEGPGKMPPPTFTAFISGLATQTFVTLGMVENPFTGKKEKDLDAARHLLDTLGMLQEKTQGNLTPQESSYLEELLYNLRMTFVKESQ